MTSPRAAGTTRQIRRLARALMAFLLVGSAAPAGTLQAHTVQAGDTLYRLAQRAGVDTADLMKLNGLSGTALKPGQMIRLPDPPPAHLESAPTRPARTTPAQTVPARPVRIPSAAPLPRPDLSRVPGPVIWTTPPAPTVASFTGWFPLTASSIGDALPVRTYLRGLAFNFQTSNNCGPSALSSVLGFYQVRIGQDVIQRTARPGGGYM